MFQSNIHEKPEELKTNLKSLQKYIFIKAIEVSTWVKLMSNAIDLGYRIDID